jgi:folylpolyglutamate synthase/dihydropteroate synthase
VTDAIKSLCDDHGDAKRVLILGSLYLAGTVLAENS